MTWLGKAIHPIRSNKCLLLDENPWRWWIEDRFQDPLWLLWVSSYAFWPLQRSGYFPGIRQKDFGWKVRYLCYRISGWYTNLHRGSRQATRWGCALGFRATTKILPFCQPEEVSFSSRWGSFPRVCSIIQGDKYRSKANQGSQEVAWAKVSTKHPRFLRFCQYLLTIHQRFQ